MILADKIIQLRKKAGWSQEELAEQLGVTRQSVSKWEGAQSVPDLEKVLQLSSLFHVTTDYLLKDGLFAGAGKSRPENRMGDVPLCDFARSAHRAGRARRQSAYRAI